MPANLRGGPSLVVRPEGAAKVALIGPPNAGKSSLHARLTGSNAHVAAYPFARKLPTLMLANKADAIAGIGAELKAFLELGGLRYPALAVSANSGQGLAEIGAHLFANLHVVRVYTKAPGHPPDKLIHRRGTWRNLDQVEYATLEWVDWFNNRRLLEPIGNIPPAEYESKYHQSKSQVPMTA